MTNGNSARDEALKKWIKEVDGNSIEVTSLMKSAYRDGWEDCRKLSICADGGKGPSDARDTEREYERIAATAIADSWTNQDIFEEGYRAALSVCADGGKDSSDAEPVAYLSTEPRNWDGSRIKPQGTFTIPVYTRPQPRYLTDEEIEEISHQRETWSVVEFGRALINAAIAKEEK